MCSENYICTLFENKADSNLKKIFSVRGNTMSLQKNVRVSASDQRNVAKEFSLSKDYRGYVAIFHN